MGIIKLTVTISEDNYGKIEEERKTQKISRSAFVDRILRAYFGGKMKGDLVRKYIEGYIKILEGLNEANALVEAQSPVLGEFK